MCILFYDDQQEHELEYKEKIHLILLFVLYGLVLLCIFDVHFQMHGMYKCCPRIFNFLCMKYFVIDLHWSRNDLKVTEGVETFVC